MPIYSVQPGDTVDTIASAQNIPVELILWENQIEYPYRLAIGQILAADELFPCELAADGGNVFNILRNMKRNSVFFRQQYGFFNLQNPNARIH